MTLVMAPTTREFVEWMKLKGLSPNNLEYKFCRNRVSLRGYGADTRMVVVNLHRFNYDKEQLMRDFQDRYITTMERLP